jgi:hypothetical protein
MTSVEVLTSPDVSAEEICRTTEYVKVQRSGPNDSGMLTPSRFRKL